MVLVSSSTAAATWSIVAADADTGQIGAAVASCVEIQAVGELDRPIFLLAVDPGNGIGIAQAAVNLDVPPKIEELLGLGLPADEILEFVIDEEFDDQADARQHAIVVLPTGSAVGEIASFTGENTQPESLDRQGDLVSVQGNLLAGEAVVDDALAAFADAPDLPLEDRLVAALVAGAEAGGDRRCGEQTALFAHVIVSDPGDEADEPSFILSYAAARGGENPVELLAEGFAAGERTALVVPEGGGRGALLNTIGLFAGLILIVGGWYFWRQSYRRPRKP